MAKLTLNTIGSRYGSIDALNDNFNAIEAAIENTLSLDGASPNTLTADLDLNGQDILNAGVVNVGGLSINGVLVEPTVTLSSGVAFQTYEYIATAGQTTFSVAPATPSNASLVVIVNGLQLSPTEVSVSSTNVLTPAMTLGDEVVIRRYTATPAAAPDADSINFIAEGTGAVTRTVQEKLRDVYSVTDFDAIGDNATDNTNVFNSIEALAATLFYLPAGTYRTTHLQLTKTYWGPGVIRFNDGYIQKGVDFTEQSSRNITGNRTVSAPGDLVLNPNGNVTFAGKRIQNIGSPIGNLDGVNLDYINTEVTPRIDALEAAISDVDSGSISYTTGTFTPVLSGGTVGGTGTYTLQQGSWVKIGKLLTVRARVIFNDHTGSGAMNMSFGAFNAPAGAGQIGQVLTTFPYGLDSTPNYASFLFSSITTTGVIAFYRKQSDGLYTTVLNLVAPHSGTATAGGASTITLAAAANANSNYYCDRTIKITGGTGVGQQRQILFYNGTTKVATTTSAWTTIPDATSTYTVTCSGSVDTVISVEV